MHKIKYLALLALGLFFCGVNHSQDQTINENLFLGADDNQLGPNQRLYFGGASENAGDPLWISRFDRFLNHTDLRVSIGDDNADDRFVIGTTFWQDGAYHPYFVVQSNGRVGIGTETIGDERLAVNGKIRAKEVKIEASSWDTPWPDYVFSKSYELPQLSSVERFIGQHHHLPEMPSAKAIEKNGIELGENNKLLLKKVEELTLYLIEQNKQLKDQQKQINNLKNQMSKK